MWVESTIYIMSAEKKFSRRIVARLLDCHIVVVVVEELANRETSSDQTLVIVMRSRGYLGYSFGWQQVPEMLI